MIGCDIVAISRLERIYNRYGVNFLDKFLSKDEQGLVFSGLRGENSSKNSNKPNFATIAGFFAAKEAASKALGCGICELCGFLDIRIYKDAKNAPKLEFSSKIKAHFKLKEAFVSIAHDGGFAMAVVALKFA